MKHRLAPALALPLLLALSDLREVPRFAPEEGVTVTKTAVTKVNLSLDDMSTVVSGQEMPQMDMEMNMSSTQTIAVTDTYVALGDGRPATLERSFDELASTSSVAMNHPMMGEQNQDLEGSSELEGYTVRFRWEDGEYVPSFADDAAGDEELLEGLEADLDLLGMLPDGDVGEDEEWEVEPNALRHVFAPAGAVKIQPEEAEGMMGMGPSSSPSLNDALGELDGDVTGTFLGFREEGGVRVAAMEYAIDVSSAKDLTEHMEEMMAEMEMPEGMDIDVEIDAFDMEFLFEGEARLLWNMETGLLHSLEVTGDLGQVVDMAMTMAMAGSEQELEQTMSMSGTINVRITVDA